MSFEEVMKDLMIEFENVEGSEKFHQTLANFFNHDHKLLRQVLRRIKVCYVIEEVFEQQIIRVQYVDEINKHLMAALRINSKFGYVVNRYMDSANKFYSTCQEFEQANKRIKDHLKKLKYSIAETERREIRREDMLRIMRDENEWDD